jgi:hypothetical protein
MPKSRVTMTYYAWAAWVQYIPRFQIGDTAAITCIGCLARELATQCYDSDPFYLGLGVTPWDESLTA